MVWTHCVVVYSFTFWKSWLSPSSGPMPVKQQMNVVLCVCGVVFGVQFRRKSGVVSLAAQRFYAMLVKHAVHTWRNRVVTIVQLLLPVIFAILACLVVHTIPTAADPPALSLDLSDFNEPIVPYTSSGANELAKQYSEVADRYGEAVSVDGSRMDDYLLDIAKGSLGDYNRKYIVAGTANDGGILVGHFNNFALHSIAMSLSLADNAMLRHVVSENSRLVTVNHPLPLSVNTRANSEADAAYLTGFSFSFNVSFGLAFLVGSFVVFVVNQRSNKAKHSQFVSGVDAVGYWLAAFVWDLLSFIVPSILIVVVVLAFQTVSYSEWPVVG